MLYDFGPRLLKLRKDKNLTQQMVVERAKGFDPNLRLSDSVLGKYESDLAVPRLTEAAALADVLNVSLDYLTSGEKCNVLSLKEWSWCRCGLTDRTEIAPALVPAKDVCHGCRAGSREDDLWRRCAGACRVSGSSRLFCDNFCWR